MKARFFQAIALIALFAVGVVLFRGCDSAPAEGTSEYVPPAP